MLNGSRQQWEQTPSCQSPCPLCSTCQYQTAAALSSYGRLQFKKPVRWRASFLFIAVNTL